MSGRSSPPPTGRPPYAASHDKTVSANNSQVQRGQGRPESPYLTRNSEELAATTPWQPMKAYEVSFSGAIEALNHAVIQCRGAVYCDTDYSSRAILVVPADVTLFCIREVLETGGSNAIILDGRELGPP